MSRYLGPIWKKSRALHFSLLGNNKEFSRGKKRINPPGMHGGKRKRLSPYAYALKLQAKQTVMYFYGLRDNQLKNEYIKAKRKSGEVGTNLLISLESRLDNLVFRSGLVNTLRFARQLVSHGHILVNDQKVKIPSLKVKEGQKITLKKKMTENKLIKNSLEQNVKFPPFLDFDRQKLVITYLRYPVAEEFNKGINTDLLIEWYNRKV